MLFWEGGGGNSCILAVLSTIKIKRWAEPSLGLQPLVMLLHSVCLEARAVEGKELPCRTKDVLLFYVFSSNASVQVSLGLCFPAIHTISEVVAAQFQCTIWCSWVSIYATCFSLLLAEVLGSSWGEKKKSCSDLTGVIWLSRPGYLENWHLKPALSKQKSKCFRCWKTENGDESWAGKGPVPQRPEMFSVWFVLNSSEVW